MLMDFSCRLEFFAELNRYALSSVLSLRAFSLVSARRKGALAKVKIFIANRLGGVVRRRLADA
jgi:hypothetical protein